MAANIHRHPAPNRALGELMPGWYDIPQNPLMASNYGVAYTPTLGEIMPGSFTIPENPLWNIGTGTVKPIGIQPGAPGQINGQPVATRSGSGSGMGCGCGGGHGSCGCGGGGMGDISTDLSTFMADLSAGNYSQALFTDTIMGFPSYAVIGVLAVAGMWFFGGTGDSRATKTYRTVRRKVTA